MKFVFRLEFWLILCLHNGIQVDGYSVYTLDDPGVCNKTLYLSDGHKSAAILKLTSGEAYDTRPRVCHVIFQVPVHSWSGLTAVIEELDLRKYTDVDHHLAQDVCIDYILVEGGGAAASTSHVRQQCGTWKGTLGGDLPTSGPRKALYGYCPRRGSAGRSKKCQLTQLKVTVSIGTDNHLNSHLWKNYPWETHKGFTMTITAYSYPTQNGETECREGLRSCSQDGSTSNLGENHCVHSSLWCDDHVNCGMQLRMDEVECVGSEMWGEMLPEWVVPTVVSFMFSIMCVVTLFFLIKAKILCKVDEPASNGDMMSYAESYELSSNVSSNHHMAIQVRVVCNSNHPHYSGLNRLAQWKPDLPPAYDSLFPGGPPDDVFRSASNVTTSIIATVEGAGAVGVNVTSITTAPQENIVSNSSSSATTSTSVSSTMPSSASIMSSREGHPSSSLHPISGATANDVTSFIDLNVIQNRNIATTPSKKSTERKANNRSGAGPSGVNRESSISQTSVTLTVKPSTPVPPSPSSVENSPHEVLEGTQDREPAANSPQPQLDIAQERQIEERQIQEEPRENTAVLNIEGTTEISCGSSVGSPTNENSNNEHIKC